MKGSQVISEDISDWTVLVVDDDRDNLRVPELILQYLGAGVYTASDGEEGLRILENVLPTLVLIDLLMPVMDGWTTLEHIRAREETANLPVIAVTAHAMAGDREKVEAAGFDGYVAKPYMIEDFLAEIMRCVAAVNERQIAS